MDSKEKLIGLCAQFLKKKGLDDDAHKSRLKEELKEIEIQNEYDYFVDLYEEGIKADNNENNLLIPYLLDIVDEFDINSGYGFVYGDFPDVDIDYLPTVRDYLKNEWAPKFFGEDKVCNIGNYTTFGIKSALIDMVRVHCGNREEMLNMTTQLGIKDHAGNTLTWDKALEENPALLKYCEENSDISVAAQRLIGRNRGMGMHAGGLIVSSSRIDNLVPLVRGKDKTQVSAWVEGLSGQDLQPVGLVKFDLLVITNNLQVAKCCKLIKERHGIEYINALPNQSDWSDISYLNDPKALEMANRGDLRCVFQFDSDGIRQLAKMGGVTSFDDLVAYTSLYRPGPLSEKMHDAYANRKRGIEEYEINPLIEPVLGVTYGVMVYQEQIMQMLNVVGDIPLRDCEIVRKAISKKQVEKFIKYKEMFVENGQINLDESKENVEELWKQIEAFAGYGFNKSHACAYTYLSSRLLWLKAHYPIEFFASILSCEGNSDKIREYKIEAAQHGVEVCPLDINKSNVEFSVVDDKIFFGISNVKGIGEVPAAKIASGGPYNSFKEFLNSFGTDANVIKPFVCLKVFEDAEPVKLYKYYEFYKAQRKKIEDRRKRFQKSTEKYQERLRDLLPGLEEFAVFDDRYFDKWEEKFNADRWKELDKLRKRRNRSIVNFNEKEKLGSDIVDVSEFEDEGYEIYDDDLLELLNNEQLAEYKFYGFGWIHPLQNSPDFDGNKTFDHFRAEHNVSTWGVEVVVVKVEQKVSKNKKTKYWLIEVEDANWERNRVIFWSDDWVRWKDDVQVGNILKMRMSKPDPPFKSYKFDSQPRHKRHLIPKEKSNDFRILMMNKG